jgi:predicted metalloprotease with PDZ domain
VPSRRLLAKAHVIGEGLSKCSRWTPRGRRGQHAETQLFWPGDPEWTALRRDTDFYSGGALIWLEADTIIRQQSGGRRSLDDFCRAFFGGMNSAPIEKIYTRDDLIAALTQVAPHDWNQFFQTHIYELAPRAPLLGIENSGWTLIYDANVNETEQDEHSVNLIYSLGMVVQQTARKRGGHCRCRSRYASCGRRNRAGHEIAGSQRPAMVSQGSSRSCWKIGGRRRH